MLLLIKMMTMRESCFIQVNTFSFCELNDTAVRGKTLMISTVSKQSVHKFFHTIRELLDEVELVLQNLLHLALRLLLLRQG